MKKTNKPILTLLKEPTAENITRMFDQHGLVDVASLPVLSVDGVTTPWVRPDADAVTGTTCFAGRSGGRLRDYREGCRIA